MFKKGVRVKLTMVSQNKAMSGKYRVGMTGVIEIEDDRLNGYSLVKWDNGEESNCSNGTLEVIG